MVDRVLEHAGNRAVVFGRDEEHARSGGDLAFETLHRLRLRRIVVLIIERQIVDLRLREGEFGRRQLCDGAGELAVVRISAKTADQNEDRECAHGDLPLFSAEAGAPALKTRVGSSVLDVRRAPGEMLAAVDCDHLARHMPRPREIERGLDEAFERNRLR